MKIIINCSTISATGATQVSASFIHECIQFKNNNYLVLLSKSVARNIAITEFPSNFLFRVLDNHPLYGLKGYQIRKELKKLEDQFQADVIFSVFGPSWWTPKKPHLMGFAYPYIIYKDSPYFQKITVIKKFEYLLREKIHLHFLKKNGKYLVCETDDTSKLISRKLSLESHQVFTVGNTHSSLFNDFKTNQYIKSIDHRKMEYRFLTLCSYSKHKNLEIINLVVDEIRKLNLKIEIKFILTIDENSYKKYFNKETKKYILNKGQITNQECPDLYASCDFLFLPTLLECFSANYPEAMKMKLPILTSDLSFAKSVCGNAALYFNPMDPRDILDKMLLLISNDSIKHELIKNGELQLLKMPTAKQRAEMYLNILNSIRQND
jgi:glycosyltransferase involved in cell wall biosynthesis